MSQSRNQSRKAAKYKNRLYEHLAYFYAYLAKQPQPSDDEVISKYKVCCHSWVAYCKKHDLNEKVQDLFKNEIAQTVWNKMQKAQQSEEAQKTMQNV